MTHFGSASREVRSLLEIDALNCLRSMMEITVPHQRRRSKGSFASHLDELVAHFPDRPRTFRDRSSDRTPELQEKLDIHALLFERAWRIDEP